MQTTTSSSMECELEDVESQNLPSSKILIERIQSDLCTLHTILSTIETIVSLIKNSFDAQWFSEFVEIFVEKIWNQKKTCNKLFKLMKDNEEKRDNDNEGMVVESINNNNNANSDYSVCNFNMNDNECLKKMIKFIECLYKIQSNTDKHLCQVLSSLQNKKPSYNDLKIQVFLYCKNDQKDIQLFAHVYTCFLYAHHPSSSSSFSRMIDDASLDPQSIHEKPFDSNYMIRMKHMNTQKNIIKLKREGYKSISKMEKRETFKIIEKKRKNMNQNQMNVRMKARSSSEAVSLNEKCNDLFIPDISQFCLMQDFESTQRNSISKLHTLLMIVQSSSSHQKIPIASHSSLPTRSCSNNTHSHSPIPLHLSDPFSFTASQIQPKTNSFSSSQKELMKNDFKTKDSYKDFLKRVEATMKKRTASKENTNGMKRKARLTAAIK